MSDMKAAKDEILRDLDRVILNTKGVIFKTKGETKEELVWAITLLKQAYTSIDGVLNDAQKTALDG